MSEPLPFRPLERPLDPPVRARIERVLRALIAWQVDLERWPSLEAELPDATPIVSLYADGRLVGCSGTTEGEPGARLARAFVQTLGDPRFGGLAAEARSRLVAQVSYPHTFRTLVPSRAHAELEVGTHGLALVAPNARSSLLPDVALEHQLGPAQFLAALEEKSGLALASWPAGGLSTFETAHVVARLGTVPAAAPDPIAAAAEWLAARVTENGRVEFGFHPADGSVVERPPMLHGRVAVLVRALFSQSAGRGAAVRAKRWLENEIRRALSGDPSPDFPEEPGMRAGTLALCQLAGIDCDTPLVELSRRPELRKAPWYAAQVVTALGAAAPAELFAAAVSDLERDPWAPWTLTAAIARGDTQVIERAAAGLVDAVREHAPHRGGVGPDVPEVARTAATIEALAPLDTPSARAAVTRAADFVRRQQLRAGDYAKAKEPQRISGAFPISPIQHFLQIDVTAHALLALVAARDGANLLERPGAASSAT